MQKHETQNHKNSHPRSTPRKRDGQQIDIGTYHIFQAGQLVAELLVTADPGNLGDANRQIEYWGLYTTFANPSPTNADTSLQFVYTRMDYASTPDDFKRHLAEIGEVRYITASCVKELL